MTSPATFLTLEIIEMPILGMDCAACAQSVRQALLALPGVATADVLLGAEKAILRIESGRVDPPTIRAAIISAGYRVGPVGPSLTDEPTSAGRGEDEGRRFTRAVLGLFGIVFGTVLFLVVVGEWFGLLEALTERVSFPIGLVVVLAFGYPIFRNVVRATRRRRVISHTLMTVGVVAALVVGQWATAAVIVFFMRVGDFAERFTTERGRRAVRDLMALAPRTARVERDGREEEIPVAAVRPGDLVVVRPGEAIPVDGEVVAGRATVDQAAITGESMPVAVEPGAKVFAATIATLGSLRVRTERVGRDTTFGRVVRLVEEAEGSRSDVQRLADRVSGWFLPVVATIAVLTLVLSRDPLATAAVLVVACSCSLALATPIAMLATIGGAAKWGLLIKGGRHVETLARVDVLLLDKTGTLTLGRPCVTDVVPLSEISPDDALALAAAAERDSEHPLASAVRVAATARGLLVASATGFEALPGQGVRATIEGVEVVVGGRRLLPEVGNRPEVAVLEAAGKSTLLVTRDGLPVAVIAAADILRPEVPAALAELRRLGIRQIEVLTGDHQAAATAIAGPLGIGVRAGLLPEDKIAIVREYQARGLVVAMIGDGVNDAPALAQADVGIAMGAAGSAVAVEAAHVALLRDDWSLVPELFRLSQRAMRVVKINLGFTAAYNVVGLSLAAFGLLPPMMAAAAQSLPDLGILANSARLLRSGRPAAPAAAFPLEVRDEAPIPLPTGAD